MNIKNLLQKWLLDFKTAWNLKIFRFAIFLQIFYLVISSIITLLFFRNLNDFRVYYEVGEAFVTDITNLYNIEYQWPFRYFPLSALFFIPFYLLGFDLGFIIFNIINLILNGFICLLLVRIILIIKGADHETSNNRVIFYISLYLMGTPQIFNFILGQVNLYITVLILLSLYIFLKFHTIKWELLASLILGISVIFKPITLLMFPFLILMRYNKQTKKLDFQFTKSLIRIIGALIPVSFNLILFLLFPSLLKGFINVNLTGEDTVLINHSMSITKIISNLLFMFGIQGETLLSIQLPLFLIILCFFASFSLILYFFLQGRRFGPKNLIYGFTLGILIMFFSYFDTWNHHLLILNPLLIIIMFNLPRKSVITQRFIKMGFFFLNFFDIIFMGIFFITQAFFPLNFVSTIFLFMILYGIFKYCYTGDPCEKSNVTSQ